MVKLNLTIETNISKILIREIIQLVVFHLLFESIQIFLFSSIFLKFHSKQQVQYITGCFVWYRIFEDVLTLGNFFLCLFLYFQLVWKFCSFMLGTYFEQEWIVWKWHIVSTFDLLVAISVFWSVYLIYISNILMSDAISGAFFV